MIDAIHSSLTALRIQRTQQNDFCEKIYMRNATEYAIQKYMPIFSHIILHIVELMLEVLLVDAS